MAAQRRPEPPADPSAERAIASVAEVAFAIASMRSLPAVVEIVGEAVREAVDGVAWRFFRVDGSSGTVTRWSGEPYLPEPGGAIEWLLRHETALYQIDGRAGGTSLESKLWTHRPRALLGLPVASRGTLHGLLLVALDRARELTPEERVLPRVLVDQFALALERHALQADASASQDRISALEGKAHSGEQLLSELISVVAHEIRTPLTAIKAYVETLIEAPASEFEQRREFLGVINDECDRLGRLVADALDFSRLEAGHRRLKVRTIPVAEVFHDVLATLAPEAARRDVELAAFPDPALGDVEADPDLLKQLLLNLVGNAIKFSPTEARVRVAASAEGSDWRLEIQDSGLGIPEDQLDRIFERFYRVELRGGRRVAGTGLGLAIARHVVELHGGRIWAENAPEGGSVFQVRMPRRQLAPESVRRTAGSLAGRADVRSLLDAAVDMVAEVMHCEIVSIQLVDAEIGDLYVAAARGLDDEARKRRTHYRGGVAGAAMAAERPLLVENIETDRRFLKRNHPQYFTKSLLCAPLVVGAEIVGVLNVNNKVSRRDLDEQDLAVLIDLSGRLSGFLSRAHAYPEAGSVISEALEMVQAVTRLRRECLLDGDDLARYAESVADRLALGDDVVRSLRRALELEAAPAAGDVPDTRVPQDDALGPGVAAILRARNEWMNGSGHPHGLAGPAIPAGARILAVLEAFQGLTRGRSFRPALSADDALGELAKRSGTQFDPRVLAAFAAVLGDEGCLGLQREVA